MIFCWRAAQPVRHQQFVHGQNGSNGYKTGLLGILRAAGATSAVRTKLNADDTDLKSNAADEKQNHLRRCSSDVRRLH
jgi:hypothetical protein